MIKSLFKKAAAIAGLSVAMQATPTLAMPITDVTFDRDNGFVGSEYEEDGYRFTLTNGVDSVENWDQLEIRDNALTSFVPWGHILIDNDEMFKIDSLSLQSIKGDTGEAILTLYQDTGIEELVLNFTDELTDFDLSQYGDLYHATLGAFSGDHLSIGNMSASSVSVDEPSGTIAMLGLGIAGLMFAGRKKVPA